MSLSDSTAQAWRRVTTTILAPIGLVLACCFALASLFASDSACLAQVLSQHGKRGEPTKTADAANSSQAKPTAPAAAPQPTGSGGLDLVQMAAPPGSAAQPTDVAARLKESGAGACAAQLNTLAAGAMQGTTQINTVSQWPPAEADKRLVAVTIAQKYPSGGVPYATTSIMAVPTPRGGCDAMSVQVMPSPLSCPKLRKAMASGSRDMGDLVGIALMHDVGQETMLVPTSGNTCVLVGIKSAYSK